MPLATPRLVVLLVLAALPLAGEDTLPPLPEGAVVRMGDHRFRHSMYVVSIVWSPDGKRIATLDAGKFVSVWEADTGIRISKWHDDGGIAPRLAFSPDGTAVVGAMGNGIVGAWDASTGRSAWQWRVGYIHADLQRVAEGVASIEGGRTIYYRPIPGGEAERTFSAAGRDLATFSVSPDGKKLAAGTKDGFLHVWDFATGSEVCSAQAGPSVDWIAFTPRGITVLLFGRDGEFRTFDADSGRPLVSFRPEVKSTQPLALSPDGERLACVSPEQGLCLLNAATGEVVAKSTPPVATELAVFSPDGSVLAYAEGRGLRTWKWREEASPKAHVGLPDNTASLAVSPDGKQVASTSLEGTLCLWDAATGELLFTLRHAPDRPPSRHEPAAKNTLARFAPDGKCLVSWGPGDELILWDPVAGAPLRRFAGPEFRVWDVAFSQDGSMLACVGDADHVRVYDVAKGEERGRLSTGRTWTRSVRFLSGDRWLAVGGGTAGPVLVEIVSGRVLDLNLPEPSNVATAVSANGAILAAMDARGQVHAFEVDSGHDILAGASIDVGDGPLAVDPTGTVLACGSRDGTVIVDLVQRRVVRRFPDVWWWISCLEWSPDGRRLYAGVGDGTVIAWDLASLHEAQMDDALWEALADGTSSSAFEAFLRLEAAPGPAVEFLTRRLAAAPAASPAAREAVTKLLADEGAPATEAIETLRVLGPDALPAIVEAFKEGPSKAARARLERIMRDAASPLAIPPGETLRRVRCVQALERIGGPEARKALDALARGPEWAVDARDARLAIARLDAAPPTRPSAPTTGEALPEGAVARLGGSRFRLGAGVEELVFSPDGRHLGALTHGRAAMFDAVTGALSWSVGEVGTYAAGLSFSPDGRLLACGACSGALVLDAVTGEVRARLAEGGGSGLLATFSPDGARVAVFLESGGHLVVFDAASGKEAFRIPCEDRLRRLRFGPQGLLVACQDDGRVTVWSTDDGSRVIQWQAHPVDTTDLAFSPLDPWLLATADIQGGICLWDLDHGCGVRRIQGPGEGVNRVAFSAEGEEVVASSQDGTTRFWRLVDGRQVERARTGGDWGGVLALHPDGRRVAGSCGPSILVWERGADPARDEGRDQAGVLFGVDVSPDGTKAATGATDGTVALWDLPSGQRLLLAPTRALGAPVPCFSANGRRLCGVSWDGTMVLWDIASGRPVELSVSRLGVVMGKAVTSDRRTLVTFHSRGGVREFELSSGRETERWTTSSEAVSLVGVAPDGAWCAAIDGEFQLRFWRTDTQREVELPSPVRVRSSAVAVSPGGRTLAVLDMEQGVALIEAARGQSLLTIGSGCRDAQVLEFSADGTLLASGHDDGSVRLWNARTGAQLRRLVGHEGRVTSLVFGADGAVLVSGGLDGMAVVWDVAALRTTGGRQEVAVLWEALAGADPALAASTMRDLRRRPEEAVSWIARRIAEPPAGDPPAAESPISSPGVALQRLRGIRVLEGIGDAAARDALRAAAAGSPWPRERELAQEAIDRLESAR